MTVRYKDYYRLLSVPRDASQEMIQQAFRLLARKYHPDLNKSFLAEEKFKGISEAYEVLRDPQKRKQYDALGSSWREGQEFDASPAGTSPGSDIRPKKKTNGSQVKPHKPSSGFSDFFDSVFGNIKNRFDKKKKNNPYGWGVRGQDIDTSMDVTLEETFFCSTKSIEVEITDNHSLNSTHRKRYEVKIPEGTKEGLKIRLAGQGGQGMHGGQDGDLFITIHILPHPHFSVREYDLETSIRVEPWEAALGSEIRVPTMEGFAKVLLPSGTSSGKRLRLKGKGLMMRDRNRGDQYICIEIGFPKYMSADERNAYETLALISKNKKK